MELTRLAAMFTVDSLRGHRGPGHTSATPRRWSYRDVLPEADLDALSVEKAEKAAADLLKGLAELPPGSSTCTKGRPA